ncbi:Uncharacterised protein [Bordetella pertussis]|nr:Uncharacterised protein [Bordetella pertussis]
MATRSRSYSASLASSRPPSMPRWMKAGKYSA